MNGLSHFDADGNAHMVDVSDKPATRRIAVAGGQVRMQQNTLKRIQDRSVGKGDVLEVARLGGIMSTKRTADLIPLCHPLKIDSVKISFDIPDPQTINITASVTAFDRTGVEMEALTAVTTTALIIYDMCKSVDRAMEILNVRLLEKSGGKSGHFVREPKLN